ncbi:MAG: hypothetical protein HOP19_02805 [Acidobacteria bacterium]|nr:hypothetical protein [Acidobacteriota bacterium]
MMASLAPPLNEIYCHYLDVYFHPTNRDEPLLTRSELATVLNLSHAQPTRHDEAASWLELLAPAWLRGESETEPFLENAEANRQWRATLRTQRKQRETTLRQKIERTAD